MATPQFILHLREHIGHELLWLAGATAVIVRPRTSPAMVSAESAAPTAAAPAGIAAQFAACEVLLVRRGDTGAWTPVTGIVDPGESPATTAVREAAEEAGVAIRVERLAQVGVTDIVEFANGDRTQFIDHTFCCTWLEGTAHVADEENTAVAWLPVAELDATTAIAAAIPAHMRERIAAALSGEVAARF